MVYRLMNMYLVMQELEIDVELQKKLHLMCVLAFCAICLNEPILQGNMNEMQVVKITASVKW